MTVDQDFVTDYAEAAGQLNGAVSLERNPSDAGTKHLMRKTAELPVLKHRSTPGPLRPQLRQLHQSYKIDGLSRAERYELQQRLERLERRIQTARFDRDGRYDDDDRYDDDHGGYYGRNGCPPGLAKKYNGCLPPGQAKKQNHSDGRYWSNYGDRYENTDRFIYRRDGDRVLQIDRRTGQVVRVINTRR